MGLLLKSLLYIEGLLLIALTLFRWALVPRHREIVSAKFFGLALFTPIVALFCGNVLIFWLYLVLAVAFTSRARFEVAGAYLFLLPQMPGLEKQVGFGGMYLGQLSSALAMGLGALIGAAVAGAGPGRRELRTLPRYDLGVFGIVLIFMFVYDHDLNGNGLVRGLAQELFGVIGPFLLISRSVKRPAEIERLLLRLCLGGTIVAVTACFQARTHWVVFETYLATLHIPQTALDASLSMRAGLLRTGGSMVNYGAGGLYLAVTLTVLPLLRHRLRPVGFWALVAAVTGGLVASESRGAWVAAIIGLTFIAACRGRWGRVLFIAGGAVAAEAMVLVFATSGRLAEILGNAGPASGNVTYRTTLATKGVDQVLAHPLLGQSPDQLAVAMSDLRQGEGIVDFVNGHLYVAMAAGVPAFLLWMTVILMPVVEGWKRRHGEAGLLAIAPAAIMVPVAVALTFTSFIDRNLTWAIVALGLAGPCLSLGRSRAVARPRQPIGAAIAV